MAMTSIEPPRRSRRWIYLGLVLIALGAGAYFGIVGGLKNCRWLDRLLGISGCIASHRVTGLEPALLWQTLVIPAGGDTIAFVGRESRSTSSTTSVLVLLDAASGAQKQRIVLAKTKGPLGAVGAADGERIALICEGGQPCFDDGAAAVIVAARDGRRLTTVDRYRHTDYWAFPGQPGLPGEPGDRAINLPGGALFVNPSIKAPRRVEIRHIADNSVVRALRNAQGTFEPLAVDRMAASPTGRRLAVLGIEEARGRFVAVFDVESGMQVASLSVTDATGPAMAWLGEDRLVLVRAAGPTDDALRDLHFDIYAVPVRR